MENLLVSILFVLTKRLVYAIIWVSKDERRLNVKFYKLECGVLLFNGDPEFEFYNEVYDRQFGYYDEHVEIWFNKYELMRMAKDYIADGISYTYGVITEHEITVDDFGGNWEDYAKVLEEIAENWYIEDWVGMLSCLDDRDTYDPRRVVYSAYKDDTGELHENFIERTTYIKPAKVSQF